MLIIHKIQYKDDGETKEVLLTPMKAIHYFCTESMGYSVQKVKA